MRVVLLLLPLGVAFAGPPAGAATGGDNSEFDGLLQRQLLDSMTFQCEQAHPARFDEVDRSREAWLAKNAQVLSVLSERLRALPKARQDAISAEINAVAQDWRNRLGQAQDEGKGEATCRKVFAAFDAMPALALPGARPTNQ